MKLLFRGIYSIFIAYDSIKLPILRDFCGIHFRNREKSLENQGFSQSVAERKGFELAFDLILFGLF